MICNELEMRGVSGIYRIRNVVTNESYVGSAVDLAKREQAHRLSLEGGYHFSTRLKASWKRHGSSAFVFEVIERCGADDLASREDHWLAKERPKLNRQLRGYRRAKWPDAKPVLLQVRLDADLADVLAKYREKFELEDDSATARHALRRAFRAEGLLA